MSTDEKMSRKEQELELLKKKKRTHRKRVSPEQEMADLVNELGPSTYRVLALLGVGSQGRVYLVQLKHTEELFAMKVFKKDKIICNTKTTRSILTEHRFLATANHPFITTLYNSFQSHERLFMIMEYCPGGELFTTIKKQPGGRLTEDQVRFYASEVVLVLEYIHSKGYIYRDLKPENILLHLDGHIRMADFGLSKQGEKPSVALVARREKRKSIFVKQKTTVELCTGEVLRTNSLVGSVHYLAPEVLVSAANEGYDAMADWWAFGVLLYDMLYGFPPFQGRTNEDVIMKIVSCDYTFPPDIPASSDIKNLIKGLLKLDAKKRLCSKHGANDVKKHAFFAGEHWGLLRNRSPPIIPKIISPDDTSNFIIYEEDEDSVDFEFFSELDEDPNVISEEDQSKFSEFAFASEAFQSTLTANKRSLMPKRRSSKRRHRRHRKKEEKDKKAAENGAVSKDDAEEVAAVPDDSKETETEDGANGQVSISGEESGEAVVESDTGASDVREESEEKKESKDDDDTEDDADEDGDDDDDDQEFSEPKNKVEEKSEEKSEAKDDGKDDGKDEKNEKDNTRTPGFKQKRAKRNLARKT